MTTTGSIEGPSTERGLEAPILRALLDIASPGGTRGRLSILIFHRVLPEPDPLFPGDMHRHRFDTLCSWLVSWFSVLPLDRAVDALSNGTLPRRALCITFDDGYADNHDVAMPILRRRGLSATFFIATGYLNGGRMWNDTVVESLRRCRADQLDLSDLALPGIGWLDLRSPAALRHAVTSVLGAAKYLTPQAREALVGNIARYVGADLPNNLMMTSAQVRSMIAGGMLIGAHTQSHPILACIDEATARAELAGSKAELESLLDRQVNLLAYPNGKPGQDYLSRDVRLARQLGFRAAVSTAHGAARTGDGLDYQLPRFTPWDLGRLAFGVRMLRNLHARPAAVLEGQS